MFSSRNGRTTWSMATMKTPTKAGSSGRSMRTRRLRFPSLMSGSPREFFSADLLNRAGCCYVEQPAIARRKTECAQPPRSCWPHGSLCCGGSPDNPCSKFGAVFDGREYDELRDAVGVIEKTIPIDSRFDGDFRFREVVEHVRSSMAQAAEWQEYYVSGTGLGAEPPVSFEYVELPAAQTYGDLSFTVVQSFADSEHFKLKLSAVESASGLRLNFHYDGSRFDRESIERVAGYFQTLLSAAVADPETPCQPPAAVARSGAAPVAR